MSDQKYKITISYDGTRYSGWQIQLNAPSIQGEIEQVLSTLLKRPIRVCGAGRTDAGVHALGQTAHFTAQGPPSLKSINGLLPKDIRIQTLEPVGQDFHAQYSAIGKIYHYHLWLEKTINPFVRLYRSHYPWGINASLLKEAAHKFVGEHDFATFANLGSSVTTTVRNLYRLDVFEQEGGLRLEFEGDGFLYKMVRNIVGTLIEVATQRRSLESIETLFAAKDRKAAGMAAFPSGLFLCQVHYSRFSPTNEDKCIKG